MTLCPLTNIDFLTDLRQFHDLDTELDLHRIMGGFHGAFATSVVCQQGTLTLLDTWFRPIFWGPACAPVETRFLEHAMSLLDFSPWIPLGTFSILLTDTEMVCCYSTILNKIIPILKLESKGHPTATYLLCIWFKQYLFRKVTWFHLNKHSV